MARRRQAAALLVLIASVLFALLLAFPAAGDPNLCPKDWNPDPNWNGSERERNSNFYVCSKNVNGKGNSGEGHNVKDDGPH